MAADRNHRINALYFTEDDQLSSEASPALEMGLAWPFLCMFQHNAEGGRSWPRRDWTSRGALGKRAEVEHYQSVGP